MGTVISHTAITWYAQRLIVQLHLFSISQIVLCHRDYLRRRPGNSWGQCAAATNGQGILVMWIDLGHSELSCLSFYGTWIHSATCIIFLTKATCLILLGVVTYSCTDRDHLCLFSEVSCLQDLFKFRVQTIVSEMVKKWCGTGTCFQKSDANHVLLEKSVVGEVGLRKHRPRPATLATLGLRTASVSWENPSLHGR
jgi:hypothetical protein